MLATNTTPKDRYVTHAAGTWTYIRRCTSPCDASGGTTNSPIATVAARPTSVAAPMTRCARYPPSRVSARYTYLIHVLRSALDRQQVLHEIVLLLGREPQVERRVVVLHHRQQGREPAVVVEAARLVGP